MSRRTIVTEMALARVTSLIDQGQTAAEIASEIGCALGTLRVRCSQHRISFRRPASWRREGVVTAMDLGPSAEANAAAQGKSVDRVNLVDQSRTVVSESSVEVRDELKVLLPQITTEQLWHGGA